MVIRVPAGTQIRTLGVGWPIEDHRVSVAEIKAEARRDIHRVASEMGALIVGKPVIRIDHTNRAVTATAPAIKLTKETE